MLGLAKQDSTSNSGAIKLIGLFVVLRLVVSYFFPASIDETYAIAVSRQISLSYFDHPPLGFNIAHFMVWLTGTENIFFVRLPFIAMGSLSAWLIYVITRAIYDHRAAYWALGWFLVAPYFFISSGHFVVPDGPLNLALLLAFYCLLPVLLSTDDKPNYRAWIGFGIFLAIALSSKYQAVLFGFSFAVFLCTTTKGRKLLRTPAPWIAAAISAIGLLPVLIWNAQHDFISFTFQSRRAGNSDGIAYINFLQVLAGQIFYLLPGTWVVALYMSKQKLFKAALPIERAMAWIVLIPATIFLVSSLFSQHSLPHWAMSGFLFAFPMIGKWCADIYPRIPRLMPGTLNFAAVGIPLLAITVALQAQFSFIKGMEVGWTLAPWHALHHNMDFIENDDAIYVINWAAGAKIGYALGPDVTIIPFYDQRHFLYNIGDKKARALVEKFTVSDPKVDLFAQMVRVQLMGFRIMSVPKVIYEMAGKAVRFGIFRVEIKERWPMGQVPIFRHHAT